MNGILLKNPEIKHKKLPFYPECKDGRLVINRRFAFLFEEGGPPNGGGRSNQIILKLPQSRIRSTAPSGREPFL